MNFHLSYVIYPLAAIYCDFSIRRKLSPLPLVSLNYKQISSKPPCLLNLLILLVASPQLCLPLPTPQTCSLWHKIVPFGWTKAYPSWLCTSPRPAGSLPGFTRSSPVLVVLHHLVTSSALITVKWVFLPGCKRRAGADAHQPSSCHQVLFITVRKCGLIMKFAWYFCSWSNFL